MITIDPIIAAVLVVGVFIYYALKGRGSSKKEEKAIYDIYREIGEKSSEYERYQNRLNNHD